MFGLLPLNEENRSLEEGQTQAQAGRAFSGGCGIHSSQILAQSCRDATSSATLNTADARHTHAPLLIADVGEQLREGIDLIVVPR